MTTADNTQPKAGFGVDLAEQEGKGATKMKPLPPKKTKKRPPVDTDNPKMDEINAKAGFSGPPVARKSAKRPVKSKLPRIGPDPLNWTEDETMGQISIPGRTVVFERFKALREEMDQPGWVVLNALLAHWEHNPPAGYKPDST